MQTNITKEKLRDILGCMYTIVEEFFCKTIAEYAKKYDYVVFLNTRSLLLYEIFNNGVQQHAINTKFVSNIYTIDDLMSNANVLLVSDIVMSVSDITPKQQELLEKHDNVQIKALTLLLNVVAENIDKAIFESYSLATLNECRCISEQLSKIIVESGLPNNEVYSVFELAHIGDFNKTGWFGYTQSSGITDFYYMNPTQAPLLTALNGYFCIRQQNMGDKAQYVPVVLLRQFNRNVLQRLLDEPKVRYVLGLSIIQMLNNNSTSIAYRCALLSFMLSWMYTKYVFKDVGAVPICVNKDILRYTYDDDLFKFLEDIDVERLTDFFNISYISCFETDEQSENMDKPDCLVTKYHYAYLYQSAYSALKACLSSLYIDNANMTGVQDLIPYVVKYNQRKYNNVYSLCSLLEFADDCNELDIVAELLMLQDKGYVNVQYVNTGTESCKCVVDATHNVWNINRIASAYVKPIMMLYNYIQYFTFNNLQDIVRKFINTRAFQAYADKSTRVLIRNYLLDLVRIQNYADTIYIAEDGVVDDIKVVKELESIVKQFLQNLQE